MVLSTSFFAELSNANDVNVQLRNTINLQRVRGYTNHLNAEYLQQKLVIDVHRPNHFIKVIMDPIKYELYIFDSLQTNESHAVVSNLLIEWREHECRRLNVPTERWIVFVTTSMNSMGFPKQFDSSSCGVMTAMVGYYYMLYNKFPTSQDWNQTDVPLLRLFMFHTILQLSATLNTARVSSNL